MKNLNSLNLGKGLSRAEMKNVFGGRGCKLVVANSNGTYTTYAGTCDVRITATMAPDNSPGGFTVNIAQQSFCNTGDGVAHTLTSNGGASTC